MGRQVKTISFPFTYTGDSIYRCGTRWVRGEPNCRGLRTIIRGGERAVEKKNNSRLLSLDDVLNKDNIHFEHMVHRVYPAELQLNKAYASDTEAAFLDLNLSIHNDIVSTKNYDKRDDFNFDIVNFPFLDGDVPRRPSYGVYISQLICFARASSHVSDFNNHNTFLNANFLKQGYRYHKLRKAFPNFIVDTLN